MVYRCGFSSGHQTSSSFIPGWLVLLLQLKTQHPQNSVHGILFLRQLHLPSHPLLHPHFIRCSTAPGAGGFKHRTGEKWLEPASNVQPNATDTCLGDFHQLSSKSWLYSVRAEYVSPVNQKLVEGFLLRLHDLSRETSEALLLLYGFLIDTAHKQNVPAESMHQRADHCHFLALLVHPGSHRHKTWMPWSISLWFCQQIYQTCQSLSTVQKHAFVLSFVYVTDRNVLLQPAFSSE